MTGPEPRTTLRIVHAGKEALPCAERVDLVNFVTQPAAPWISGNETSAFCRALRGEFAETSDDFFFMLIDDQELVAHAWYQVSRRNPAVAVLGYVFTDTRFRGRGLCTNLMELIWKHFTHRGGAVMYLGTSNPTARNVYLKSGFKSYNGHVMRRISQDKREKDFDEQYFAGGENIVVRKAEWGDLALATMLYTQVFPWIVRDLADNILLQPGVGLERCNSIFIALLLRSEIPGNSMVVMETAAKKIVGCASIISQPRSEDASYEFLVHPNYACHAELALRSQLREDTGYVCHAAVEDNIKIAALRELGFRESKSDESALRQSSSLRVESSSEKIRLLKFSYR